MMGLSAGTRVGPYELLSPLGAGGMGEVWRASDTRLGRVVAIKFCQARFSDRFDREAKVIAALNHPNIAQIYDVGENYLVIEYVDGDPVHGPANTRNLLDIAVQIADGLAAAHAAGVVHRDLKPDNILVTRKGCVKILDFGLAKQLPAVGAADATRTIAVTNPGTVLGTTRYMSPEQARGEELDARSDQFSFGVILYELAAGRRPFDRSSSVETMAAIIREDPPPLPATVPLHLRSILQRLLNKEPDGRYDSTRDLHRELRMVLDHLSEMSVAAEPAAPKRGSRRIHSRAVLGAVGLLFAGCALGLLIGPQRHTDLSTYHFTPITTDEGQETFAVWSPDGKSIAYYGRNNNTPEIFVKAIGASNAAQITHTRDGAGLPFWSPDGSAIYFLAGPPPTRKLWAVAPSGGEPQAITDAPPGTQSVSVFPDGKLFAFATANGLFTGVPGSGKPFARVAGFSRAAPTAFVTVSPDGSKLAVRGSQENAGGRDVALWIVRYPSGPARVAPSIGAAHVAWFPDGRHLLVCRAHDDHQNSSLSIYDTENERTETILRSATFILDASVSRDGRRIAYSTGDANGSLVKVAIDDGRTSALLTRSGMSKDPDWAASGSHYLFASTSNGVAEIEDRTIGDGFVRRLTAAGENGVPANADTMMFPQWAPDGNQFMFGARAEGFWQLWIANASGGKPRMLDPASVQSYGGGWSPDGEWIVYYRLDGKRPVLAKIRAGVGARPEPLHDAARTPTGIRASGDYLARWSPDGKWILYAAPDGLAVISPDGQSRRVLYANGVFPSYGFSKDGRSIYLVVRSRATLGWQLLSIDIESGKQRVLSDIDFPSQTEQISGFSLHPDGKHFAISVISRPRDIWMLEGFPPPNASDWRLFHR